MNTEVLSARRTVVRVYILMDLAQSFQRYAIQFLVFKNVSKAHTGHCAWQWQLGPKPEYQLFFKRSYSELPSMVNLSLLWELSTCRGSIQCRYTSRPKAQSPLTFFAHVGSSSNPLCWGIRCSYSNWDIQSYAHFRALPTMTYDSMLI